MFSFTVKPDGGEAFEVEATSRDIVRWEGMSRNNSVGALQENLRMTDLVNLCWYAADRQGFTSLDRLAFADLVDVSFKASDEDDDEDDESGPTRAGR